MPPRKPRSPVKPIAHFRDLDRIRSKQRQRREQQLEFAEQRVPVAEYQAFRAFCAAIDRAEEQRIVLRPQV